MANSADNNFHRSLLSFHCTEACNVIIVNIIRVFFLHIKVGNHMHTSA